MSIVWEPINDVTNRLSYHMNCIYILSGDAVMGILKFREDLCSPTKHARTDNFVHMLGDFNIYSRA
jgi:hypothetical protein